MNTPSFRDVEQLSAYLDGKLSVADAARLESRLRADPELGTILDELRQTRDVLRRTPQRRAPRNFTLTPKMAGLRPPVPRAVPALSWASAVAVLLFVFTLGSSLLGRLSFSTAAPMMASGLGGGNATDSGVEGYGVGGGPPAGTAAPTLLNALPETTPTPAGVTSLAPAATVVPVQRIVAQPQTSKNPTLPVNLWLIVWPGLAVVLIGTALGLRWAAVARFRKRAGTGK